MLNSSSAPFKHVLIDHNLDDLYCSVLGPTVQPTVQFTVIKFSSNQLRHCNSAVSNYSKIIIKYEIMENIV